MKFKVIKSLKLKLRLLPPNDLAYQAQSISIIFKIVKLLSRLGMHTRWCCQMFMRQKLRSLIQRDGRPQWTLWFVLLMKDALVQSVCKIEILLLLS